MERNGNTAHGPARPLAGWIQILVWILVLQTLILIPLLLLAQGFLPPDDCLRHAAKAVDGRPWSEIMVLRPGILADPHAAWNGLLRGIHLVTGWGPEALVVLTVAGLFLLVLAAPLPWMAAPEAWIATWVLLWVAGGSQIRVLLGRPFLVPMAALLTLLCLWTRGNRRGWQRLLLSTLLFGVAALLHGSWYLLLIIPVAFLAAGRRQDGAALLLCFGTGSVLAGCVSGHPIQFLAGQLIHLGHTVAPGGTPLLVVPELRPSLGSGVVGALLLGALLFQVARGRELKLLKDPLFVLALIGWLFGLKFKRFWIDWGYPSAALWLAFTLEPGFRRLAERAPWRRLALAAGACCAATILLISGDEGRWNDRARDASFLTRHADLKPWLPEPGGILYSPDMTLFFDIYFQYPHAPWRYMVGFEPGMMPPADLAVFQGILLDPDNSASYAPWINRMRPEDRFLLHARSNPQNLLPGLQWHWAERDLWLGRKPR